MPPTIDGHEDAAPQEQHGMERRIRKYDCRE